MGVHHDDNGRRPVTRDQREVTVTVVMPCLNEAASVGSCVVEAQQAMQRLGLTGEVIVADNGSVDDSPAIAERAGARVVTEPIRGYGSAVQAGCRAAAGRFIVIGDADHSYDFSEIGLLIAALEAGADLVLGSRFKGRILPHAMPWKNRYIGNPLLTFALRVLFRARGISDAHSGLRAVTRDAFELLQLRTLGMEFASEMIVRASRLRLSIAEVPITLRPALRRRAPHLRPWRDGWRHLKFMLMFAPGALFLGPGAVLMFAGLALLGSQVFAPADSALRLGQMRLGFHWAILGSLFCVASYQLVNAYFFARIYSVTHDLKTSDPFLSRAFGFISLERALALGLVVSVVGVGLLGYVLAMWIGSGFGSLSFRLTRLVIFGATLFAIGVQTVTNAFVFSIIGDRYQRTLMYGRSDLSR